MQAAFERAEYAARNAETQRTMAARGIEALVVSDPANMYYLTGYDGWSFYVPQAVVVVASEAQPVWIGRPAERGPVPGVVTFSTGNHGMGVAYVARRLGLPAYVCLPDVVPQTKLDGLRRLGVVATPSGPTQEDAARRTEEIEREQGLVAISPIDGPDIIAGQGTIGIELLEDDPNVDTVLVPLSGGGLLSGVALSVKANSPRTRVIGVCAQAARAMYESVRAGGPIDFQESPTVADSLRGGIGMENRHTLRMVRELVDDIVLVSEAEIEQAMGFLLREERMVVEGAAAVGVAALLSGRVRARARTTALITGRNVASDVLARLGTQI